MTRRRIRAIVRGAVFAAAVAAVLVVESPRHEASPADGRAVRIDEPDSASPAKRRAACEEPDRCARRGLSGTGIVLRT